MSEPPFHQESLTRRRWLEGLLIFAFWTLVAALLISSRALDERGGPPEMGWVAYQFVQAYLWALLTPFIFRLSRDYSIERSNWAARVPVHAGVAVIISLAADMIENLNIRYIASPPWGDRLGFDPVEALLELNFLNDLLIYLAVLAAGFARDYFLRYEERRAHAARLQAQLTSARLDALRMQIHPHFFFNTLHAISSLVERDPRGVRRMIARLSDLLRYTLDEKAEQEVPLRQELQFLDDYLDIQRIRFPDKLKVETDVSAEALDALVPSLIMQPLVENAVKHGISRRQGGGRLLLRGYRSESLLHLRVEDDGPGLTGSAAQGGGVGLRNVESRLRELYGDAATFEMRAADAGGLVAAITLPYHTKADLRAASGQIS